MGRRNLLLWGTLIARSASQAAASPCTPLQLTDTPVRVDLRCLSERHAPSRDPDPRIQVQQSKHNWCHSQVSLISAWGVPVMIARADVRGGFDAGRIFGRAKPDSERQIVPFRCYLSFRQETPISRAATSRLDEVGEKCTYLIGNICARQSAQNALF